MNQCQKTSPSGDCTDTSRRKRVASLSALAILVGLGQGQVQARDWLGMTGSEFSSDNAYVYAGVLAPIADTGFGDGWVQRYWVDWLYYEYDSGSETIEAKAPGASAAVGYTVSGSASRLTGYLGLGFRDTDLSPDDRSNNARGSQLGAVVQLDGETKLAGNWRGAALVSYASADSGYWSRLRLTRHSGWVMNPGVEFVMQGNDEYDGWQAGIVGLDMKVGAGVSLGLKAGVRKTSGEDAGAYAGFEASRMW